MARQTERLSDLAVRRSKKPGFYPDGRQLYLQVSPTGSKSWLFRFARQGRERWMGLGPVPDVSLAEARQKAFDARRVLREGVDPIEATPHRTQRCPAPNEAQRPNLQGLRRALYRRPRGRLAQCQTHERSGGSTLETYAFPALRRVARSRPRHRPGDENHSSRSGAR